LVERIDVGVIRLRILGERVPETGAALAYWQNHLDPAGELVFSRSVKGTSINRHGPIRTARYVAQFVSAEVTGLRCPKCGGALPPVPVTSRAQARRVWQDRHNPDTGTGCPTCIERIRTWIKAADHGLPAAISAQTVLAAEALRQSAAWGEHIDGQALIEALPCSDMQLLVNDVLVPCAAIGEEAVEFSADGKSSFYPSRIIWNFAGNGPPAQRLRVFEKQLDERLGRILNSSFGDIARAAARCIEDEVLHYLELKLLERDLPQLRDRDKAWVRQLVNEHWGRLDLAAFCTLIETEFRTAGKARLRQNRIGLQPVPSYIVCGFYTALEQTVTGRPAPRVCEKPADLDHLPDHLPRSVTVFRTVLRLDILHARPEDIELRRPAAAAAADGDLRTRILHIIEVLQPQLSDEHSELLNRFAEVYCRNALAMNDSDAFTAACNGLAYLTGVVPAPVLTELRKALTAIRSAAAQR
jgi:uncharacterized protein (UPF0212 family)